MTDIDKVKQCRIGVLSGGDSSEREISLRSGKAVFDSLNGAGFNVVLLDVTKDNFVRIVKEADIEGAFIVLHGRFGEDGEVQGLLEDMGIWYTGSGSGSSRIALDKVESKRIFEQAGMKVPEGIVLNNDDGLEALDITFPCVVKPRWEGSSVGLSRVFLASDLPVAVDAAFKHDDTVLVERFITGRELTVGVLGERPLPVLEIRTACGIYDFHAKYNSKETEYIVSPKIDKDVYEKVQEVGLNAHKALGCRGYSRVDIMLSEANEIYVLEVNTIPGMTERSLLPMAAKEAGLDFSGLCVNMIEIAIDKKFESRGVLKGENSGKETDKKEKAEKK